MTLPACAFVIFGATGDLAKRKLIPALYKLHQAGKLDPQTRIIAIGRKDFDDIGIRQELGVFISDAGYAEFSQRIVYHKLEFHEDLAYQFLKKRLADTKLKIKIFYMATAPDAFPIIIDKLHKFKIARRELSRTTERLVFEKPFGHDLKSAQELNKRITKLFNERQIFRIDHYLGKEFVQNILALRFTNPMFENLWSGKYIDYVQIVVTETHGVDERGGYYDSSGAMRDMIQNHLLQLLALTTMNVPKSLDADAIRDQKVKALRTIKLDKKTKLVLGQYTAGTIEGQQVPGYRQEKGVSPDSKTETFAAMRLELNNPRWKGVPFYLRTGKRLIHGYAQIVIGFKQTNCKLFCGVNGTLAQNELVIRIQPDEGVELQFNLKEAGEDHTTIPLTMEYVREAELNTNSTQAYERLLGDIMRSDQTLFTRWDEVFEAWRLVDGLKSIKTPLQFYEAGTHGPNAALTLIKKDGHDWFGNKPLTHYLRSRTAPEK